jgi:hypothetical protein
MTDPQTGKQVWESKEHNLQVAFSDLEQELNWNDAKAACIAQGEGWRLPTNNELKIIYDELFKLKSGNFEACQYWCEYDNWKSAYTAYFRNEFSCVITDNHYQRKVRAVRTI